MEKDTRKIPTKTGKLPPVKLKKYRAGEEEKIDAKVPLKPAHERFCQLYAGDSVYFNDATRSYAIAFGYELPTVEREDFTDPHGPEAGEAMQEKARIMNVFGAAAGRLLRSVKIQARIREVLGQLLTDDHADSELRWLMTQRENHTAKIGALKLYAELKGRIQKKIKLSGQVGQYELDPEEAEELDNILQSNA